MCGLEVEKEKKGPHPYSLSLASFSTMEGQQRFNRENRPLMMENVTRRGFEALLWLAQVNGFGLSRLEVGDVSDTLFLAKHLQLCGETAKRVYARLAENMFIPGVEQEGSRDPTSISV